MGKPIKIFLADLSHTYSVSDTSLPMPLNIGYIKAYIVENHGESVDVRLFKHPEKLLQACADELPDIVGLSNYSWNQGLNKTIGTYLRGLLPDAALIAGGPQIDQTTERRLEFFEKHDYLDFLVIDGGEEPVSEMVDWWRDSRWDFDKLPASFVWRDGDGLRDTGTRPIKKIIEGVPSPYLNGHLDEFIDAGLVPLFETNRGCPFKCTYCAWGLSSKDLVRRFDVDQAIAEINYVGNRSQARNWIICDANFGMLKRDVDIAKAIRSWKDKKGLPQKCLLSFAKNATDRNIEIGAIMGDMTDSTLAVQSMDETVLKNIKRGNISLDSYVTYQKRFKSSGVRTYADTIVPLPGETLETHIEGLRKLASFGVDDLINHMARMLPGTELNSIETRAEYDLKTRFRLIHGDAGIYKCADGTELRTFEYEESLRSTATMDENVMFFLRKLHFFVDFAWNVDVYKPLLRAAQRYDVNPIDVLRQLIDRAENDPGSLGPGGEGVRRFMDIFDQKSHEEWFDSAEEIENYFAKEKNFMRLIGNEFDKLNIQFSVVLLEDFKADFDMAIRKIIADFQKVPTAVLDYAADYTCDRFPSLRNGIKSFEIVLPTNILELLNTDEGEYYPSNETREFTFVEGERRKEMQKMLVEAQGGKTLSKIINTQRYWLRDLKLEIDFESEINQPPLSGHPLLSPSPIESTRHP